MVMETEEQPVAGEPEASAPSVSPETAAPSADEVPAVPQEAEPAAPTEIPPSIPSLAQTLPLEVEEYIRRIEEENRGAREQGELQALGQATAQYAQQLEQQYGLAPEHAQAIAKQQGNILYQQYQAEQTRRGQTRAAIAIAKEFGIDPLQLLDLPSPQAMRQTAQTLSGTTKRDQELAQLRAQVAKLTKASVPAQTFTQGAQPGAGAGLTGDALESAWLKFETDPNNQNKNNPYDSAYRAMLRG